MFISFLSGLLAAWAIAQVGLGGFFCLAFALGRREWEYLLFGASALALSVATTGTALEYAAADFAAWRSGALVVTVGLTVAVPIHLQFLLYYARVGRARQIAAVAYLVAAPFAVLRIADLWLVPGSETIYASRFLGMEVVYRGMQLRPHAMVFFLLASASLAAGAVLLFRVYRSGRREALFAALGSVLLVIAAVNDLLLVGGVTSSTIYFWPHAFFVYAFALASTLLYRYRRATGQLEQTAMSLQERTAELRHSYRELSIMEDELIRQQQLATVGQLAASIAHEVRNPLAVMVNATAALRRPTLSQADQQLLLEMIDEEAARLNGLVTDLLRFARPVSITQSRVDLRELAQRAVEGIGNEYHVELSIPDDPETSTVCVDAELLRLALSNLIDNARQAMPQGGTIRISAMAAPAKSEAQVRLEVRDEGHGMLSSVAQRALEPFYTTRPGGTGLGLPIVQRIMQAHGGDVTLHSEPEEGTAVTLHIPRYEAHPTMADPPLRGLRPRPSS